MSDYLSLAQCFSVKYRHLVERELKRASALAQLFTCPDELVGQCMDMERRQFVVSPVGKAGPPHRSTRYVEGRVFAVYCTAMASVHALLLGLLNNWIADRAAVVRRVVEQQLQQQHDVARERCCDVCGIVVAKLLQCSKCKGRRFCSRECQTADWPSHKKDCANPSFALKLE